MAIYDGKKRCCKCKEWFPATLEFFYGSKGKNSDGFQGYCKPCIKAKAVEWQKANPDKKKASDAKQNRKPERKAKTNARKRAFYAKNPERASVHSMLWRKSHPEKFAEYTRNWKERNPERAKEAQARYHAKPERKQYLRDAARFRRALRFGSGGELVTQEVWEKVIHHFGNRCCYCDAEKKVTMDHIDPISKGGLHVVGNLAPACERCNKAKRIKPVEVFAPERAAQIRATALQCEALYVPRPTPEALPAFAQAA